MVVLISPKSVKSEQVEHEIQFALTRPQYKGRLIPVVVRPTKDIPWILTKFPVIRVGKDLGRAVNRITELVKHGFELTRAAA